MPEGFKTYLFSLDYGNRKGEKEFIKAVINRFDRFELTGCGVFVNNNPYNLELYFSLSFEKNDYEFDSWLSHNYPNKLRTYNIFAEELIDAAQKKGYSLATFLDEHTVDFVMTSNVNQIFLYPDREVIYAIWNKPIIQSKRLFLSHSSKDKGIVDYYFNELQKSNIKAWYDKEEIFAGDSIPSKINEGLSECDLGIIFLSKNFLSKHSGWTESECNYFITGRMKRTKKIIVINIGLEDYEVPPLLQEYRYINYKAGESLEYFLLSVKKQLESI